MAGFTGLRGGRQHSGTCRTRAPLLKAPPPGGPSFLPPQIHLSPQWLWGSCQALGLLKV